MFNGLEWTNNKEKNRRNEMKIKSKDIKIRIIERVIKHRDGTITIEPLLEFNPPLVKKFDSGLIETISSMRIHIQYDIENNDKISSFKTIGTSVYNIINVDIKELEECVKNITNEELKAYKYMLSFK